MSTYLTGSEIAVIGTQGLTVCYFIHNTDYRAEDFGPLKTNSSSLFLTSLAAIPN